MKEIKIDQYPPKQNIKILGGNNKEKDTFSTFHDEIFLNLAMKRKKKTGNQSKVYKTQMIDIAIVKKIAYLNYISIILFR